MELGKIAIDYARSLGADFADIRIQRTKREFIFVRDLNVKMFNNDDSYGYGIRVFKNGAWGFAHNKIFTKDAVIETVKSAYNIALASSQINKNFKLQLTPERGYIDTYKTPLSIDPLSVSPKEKIDQLLEINRTLLSYQDIKQARAMIISQNDDKILMNTDGSHLKINTTYVYPSYTAVAVNQEDSQSRSYNPGATAAGWEHVINLRLLENADRVAREAIMKLNADSLPSDSKRRDLVLNPDHLALTMHESVGHPTELDRVLGWEADFAGISFATPEKLKNYQYGSEIVNFTANNKLAGGMATAGYDDDGVPNQEWQIVKDGILNEYGTTRDTASFIGQELSRGCNRATNYYDMPINRIPNLYMEPGKKECSPNDLISAVDDGVMIEGQGSFSIDQHRINFQFGGDMFWEIKNGKRTRPLKKILYRSNNPEFWNSVEAIADKRFWKSWGVNNCGKGQPNQTGRMTHGASPTLFRNIMVGGSK
jgi:TldD protein